MSMQVKGGMTLFFSDDCPLSNWYPAEFEWFGLTFLNTEQFMMYCKAMLFNDVETARKIMLAKTPREHKALGRQVQGFDAEVWDEKCEYFVEMGCVEKFRQNPHALRTLLSTKDTELVEASPYDKIWGAGLSMTDSRITDKSKWPGKNRLGYLLMRVRTRLALERGSLEL